MLYLVVTLFPLFMRIQGVAMSENLSFDSFVSKIHQV
ncbi:MAG: hypothetical protein ACI86H_001757, partial [bacterium]